MTVATTAERARGQDGEVTAGPWETEEAVGPGGRFCNVVAAAGAWPEWEARK